MIKKGGINERTKKEEKKEKILWKGSENPLLTINIHGVKVVSLDYVGSDQHADWLVAWQALGGVCLLVFLLLYVFLRTITFEKKKGEVV